MPNYEYECPPCKETSTRMVPVDVRDAQMCLQCGGKLERKSGTPAFAIHGYSAANGYAKP